MKNIILIFPVLALALVAGCAGTNAPAGHGRHEGRGHGGPAPQGSPYTDPLFGEGMDARMSQYALDNLAQGRKVFWLDPGIDRVVLLWIKSTPPPESGRPKEIVAITKRPDGRPVMVTAKARKEEGQAWKIATAFAAELDDNGQKLLQADYKEAYRRATGGAAPATAGGPPPLTYALPGQAGQPDATTPQHDQPSQPRIADRARPPEASRPQPVAPAGPAEPGLIQARPDGLPITAPAEMLPADDFQFPTPPTPAKPHHGGPMRGGHGGPGGHSRGGGLFGGMGGS